ncbi:MAG: hypothetical protein KTR31_13505 [Myxococcales bacterium]|nr:hypothetical protein [Myxococcales bacterium]
MLLAWGVALGAWLSTALTVAVGVALVRWRHPRRVAVLAALLVFVGPVEVLWSVHHIGARAREGSLPVRDKVGVYGFNVVFGTAAVAAGFADFGRETVAMGLPWSWAGACDAERLQRYGRHRPRGAAPRLRRWRSQMPLRSARIRAPVAAWVAQLPADAPTGTVRELSRRRVGGWTAADYTSARESNQVPIALSTPTTAISGVATAEDGRWRLDLVVDLVVGYPERSTLQIGPFALEEGMFHDAYPLLEPYCLEYGLTVWSDDVRLQHDRPLRGPVERLSTWVLRFLGAAYR